MTPLYAYYHLYADGDWQEPLDEYLTALDESGLGGCLTSLRIGMVGHMYERGKAWNYLWDRAPVIPILRNTADTGWEQVTLNSLHSDATHLGDAAILYAHTKSASDRSPINLAWRTSMIHDVVTNWRSCVGWLWDHDAVGPHRIHPPDGNGYFGGNFWWATAEHIRTLPPPKNEVRHDAEHWIADRPGARLYDVRPGWPGFDVFHKEGE